MTADGTFAGIVSRAGLAAKATEVELVAEKGHLAVNQRDSCFWVPGLWNQADPENIPAKHVTGLMQYFAP